MAKKESTAQSTSKPKSTTFQRRTWAGLLYTLISAIVIIGGTYLAVRWAQGDFRLNQVDRHNSTLARETGLLSANSYPTKASVYIDDKLVTATDEVLYLEPGEYQVRIVKDGYHPWQKTLQIEKSLVTSTDALLVPSTPSFTGLTFTGAENISVAPDGLKIIYYTASTSAQAKNGLYLLDINSGTFSQSPKLPKQITDDAPEYNLAEAQIIWSSDSNQFLLKTDAGSFLLSAYNLSPLASQPDVFFKEKLILSEWQEDMANRERQFLAKYPPEILDVITQGAKDIYLSPDKEKLLYTATSSATLPDHIIPQVAAASTQPQERIIEPNGVYVYDLKEDKNFRLDTAQPAGPANPYLSKILITTNFVNLSTNQINLASPSAQQNDLISSDIDATIDNFKVYHSSLYADTYQWLSDSKNLVRIKDGQVVVVNYDATNQIGVYSGQLADNFLYPWPDGSKLMILTSFSHDTPNNIYAIELKK